MAAKRGGGRDGFVPRRRVYSGPTSTKGSTGATMPDPPEDEQDAVMRITVTRNGPYVVTGGVPLTEEVIVFDGVGDCRFCRVIRRYTAQQRYALCRCGRSENTPFCDGSHAPG